MSCVDNYETPVKRRQRRTAFHPCRSLGGGLYLEKYSTQGKREREKERGREGGRERKRKREHEASPRDKCDN